MTSQFEAARQHALSIRPRGIAERSRKVLGAWKKHLESERGAVPYHLAGVLAWSAGAGSSKDPWPIAQAVAERYEVGPDSKLKVKLWAGLRNLNETGLALREAYSELFDSADDRFWTAVVQATSLGPAQWSNCLPYALRDEASQDDPIAAVVRWAREGSIAELASTGLHPAMVAYRLIVAPKRVEAAKLLAKAEIRSRDFGQLVERPDLRLRFGVARALGAAQVTAATGFGGWKLGRYLSSKLAKTSSA